MTPDKQTDRGVGGGEPSLTNHEGGAQPRAAGSWHFRAIGDDGLGYVEYEGQTQLVIAHTGDTVWTPAQNRQIGHLTAASPELLALAKSLERWLLKDVEPSRVGADDMRVYHLDGGALNNLLNEARAAIAKAEGRDDAR